MMWCIYGVQYFFGALHHWCVASWCYVYMHFWYAINRHLWWCLIGAITIVQCIFDALFLGIGCNTFLVLRLWCYALSATSRRLATAVAHLLYYYILSRLWQNSKKNKEKCFPVITHVRDSWSCIRGSEHGSGSSWNLPRQTSAHMTESRFNREKIYQWWKVAKSHPKL